VVNLTRFQKPGKGVSKDEPEKKPFFRFFDIVFTNIGKFSTISMLYSLFILLRFWVFFPF
jgi:hypothetical protein